MILKILKIKKYSSKENTLFLEQNDKVACQIKKQTLSINILVFFKKKLICIK